MPAGVASLIELARILKENESLLTHHFELVTYTLEEPPLFPGLVDGQCGARQGAS